MKTSSCKEYAVRLISAVPKTHKQLKWKLLMKWYQESEVDEVIQRLDDKWYINDHTFARLYMQSEVCKKWKPVFQIRQKLLEKWIDKQIIWQVLAELDTDLDDWIVSKIQSEIQKMKKKWIEWFEIINKIYKKWYRIDQIKQAMWQN